MKATKSKLKAVALSTIKEHFTLAKKHRDTVVVAKRHVHKARKISMKFKQPIPRALKRRFCRHCEVYFVSGKTCRIRSRPGYMVYTCLECKHIRRFRYK